MRTRNWNIIAGLAIAFSAFVSGCSSDEVTQQLTAEERYKLGTYFFENGDYLEAIEEFKIITLQFGGTQWADDAQYLMADARFRRGEYILAVYEYDMLLRTMPTSPFARQARFQKAASHDALSPDSDLDQEYTRKAIDDYQSFLEYHPADSLAPMAEFRITNLMAKLAKKEFDSGVIYLKMGYFKAATYYFDIVLERYHDTPFAEPALLRKGEALVNRKRYAEAIAELQKYIDKYPTNENRPAAERLLNEARDLQANSRSPRIPSSDTSDVRSQNP